MKSSFRVLISGEPSFTKELKKMLTGIFPGMSADTARPGDESLKAALKGKYDAIISGLIVPEIPGTELFSELRKKGIGCPFILAFDAGGELFFVSVDALVAGAGEFMGLCSDSEERIRSEEALKESEERYRNLLNGVPDYIIVHRDGKILYANPAVMKMAPVPEEQLIGSDIMEFIAPESRKTVLENLRKRAGGEATPPYEMAIETKIGKRVTEVRSSNTGYEGEIATIAVLTDITDRKEAEEALQKSREQYKSLVENIRDIIYTLDSDGTITYVSPVIESYLGIPPGDITGRPFGEFIHPDDLEEVQKSFKDTLKGKTGSQTFRVFDSEGKPRYFRSSSRTVETGETFSGFTGVLSDFTTDMTVKNELVESEERFRNMFENSPLAYQSLNNEAILIDINEEWSKLMGYSKDEALGTRFMDYVAKDCGTSCSTKFTEFMEKGEMNTELNLVKKGGDIVTVLFSGKIQRDSEGKFVRTHCILKDITERRHEEAERQLLARMSDDAPASIIVHDFEGNMIYINEETLRLHGFSRDEFMAKNLREVNSPDSAALLSERLEEIREKREINYDVEHLRKDGTMFPMHVNVKIFEWEDREVLLNIGTDISERKEMEEALKESEAKFRNYVSYATEGIFIADPSGKYIDVNPAACGITGYTKEEMLKVGVTDIALPGDLEGINKDFKKLFEDGSLTRELIIKKKDGKTVTGILNATLLPDRNVLGIYTDVSDLKRAEEGLREANRTLNLLSSITRHDILNQLTAIIAFLEMIEMDHEYPQDSKTDEYLEKISGAAQTIKRQILFTKDYKDLGEQAPKWQNAGKIVDETAMNSSFGGIRVENNLGNLGIFADPLFEKVIYNLFDNAVKHGEKITKIGFYFEESEGSGILVCEDDGMGVPEEFKKKIFKREHYKNTGLGLFLSGEILSTTGISIRENGVYGKGARFEMRIPGGMFRQGD